ncbi:MAG: AmmeMemoRadiSam system protein A [Gammaproteobacteria bacterium]|nr:AmmeMemoRadiSam system protein A [Gammaproteobacteria bacterium]
MHSADPDPSQRPADGQAEQPAERLSEPPAQRSAQPAADARPEQADASADQDRGALGRAERQRLLAIARASIAHGLAQGAPLPIALPDEPAPLHATRASFVTLELGGNLRGCIGHLEAIGPLATDVAENAFAAAFQDPRFPPLSEPELARVAIAISVLTPPEPLAFANEAELLDQITPGVDGLILSEGHRRGTFLPSVWSQLPSPEAFLRHLKQKAGLPPDYWSDQIQIARYRTESFGEQA